MLSQRNYHPRDKNIEFDEPTHVYTIEGDSDYTSVTTLIHKFFPHFDADKVIAKMRSGRGWGPNNKYYDMTDEEIKEGWRRNGQEAAELGTAMHLNIEKYYNGLPFNPGFTDSKEYTLFESFLNDHYLYIPYRTEWTVYSKKYRLAGSIDMVYIDPENEKFVIVDWKRSKEIKYSNKWDKGYGPLSDLDDCNYNKYCLQLNVYRMIIEKYYDKPVSEMFLVIIHPNQDDYIKIVIPKMSEPIMRMLDVRKRELKDL